MNLLSVLDTNNAVILRRRSESCAGVKIDTYNKNILIVSIAHYVKLRKLINGRILLPNYND